MKKVLAYAVSILLFSAGSAIAQERETHCLEGRTLYQQVAENVYICDETALDIGDIAKADLLIYEDSQTPLPSTWISMTSRASLDRDGYSISGLITELEGSRIFTFTLEGGELGEYSTGDRSLFSDYSRELAALKRHLDLQSR
jgi:hypothetical protein